MEEPSEATRSPHGFVQIIGEALSEVDLRPDQETAVEALGNHIEPLEAHVDAAEAAILNALSSGVRAGSIDRAALEPYVTDYVNARVDVSTDLRTAIDKLHSILDSAQRADFADALEARVHSVRMAILSGQRIEGLASALQLTDAQKERILDDLHKIASELEPERTAIHHAIEAFREDAFAIDNVMPKSEVPERARTRATRLIDMTEGLMKLLDSKQREKLADRIHEAATARTPETVEATPTPKGEEQLGEAAQAWWAGRGWRGGGWGWRRPFVVGAPGFTYGRVYAYPYAAGWGWGW
jgi:hypothetical protein